MKIKKSTVGVIVFIFFYSFLILFAWAWASFEPEGDIWSSFYSKLLMIGIGPITFPIFILLFRKKKWWSQELK